MRWADAIGILVAALAAVPRPAAATVFHSKESALKLAFPGADCVQPRHIFLTEKQLEEIRRLCGQKPSSKLITAYVGQRGGRAMGYAFIDTHIVRTLPETFMVVLTPEGTIRGIHILAFHEPQEYMPPAGWLKTFSGKKLSPRLAVRQEIAGIAGSTMSAMSITGATRKILAIYKVALAGRPTGAR